MSSIWFAYASFVLYHNYWFKSVGLFLSYSVILDILAPFLTRITPGGLLLVLELIEAPFLTQNTPEVLVLFTHLSRWAKVIFLLRHGHSF